MPCRLQRTREWTNRLIHEMDYFDDSCFITLTYSDEYLPENASLVKEDLQKFMKRLRRDLGRRVIKYFACGEYGENFLRPHYHAIIFGVSKKEDKLISENWSFGRIHVGYVSPESIRYVTSYVQKKLTGKMAEDEYINTGRIAPFSLISKGLGKRYALDNKVRLQNDLGFTVNGVPASLPRYYRSLLNVTGNDLSGIALKKKQELHELLEKKGLTDLVEKSKAIRNARMQSAKTLTDKLELFKKGKC